VGSGDLTFTASSPGEWANDYRVRIVPRTDDATRFKLEVLDDPDDDASVVEVFENLTVDESDPRFIGNIVNGRSLVLTVEVATNPGDPVGATVDLDGATAGADGTEWSAADADFHTALLASFGLGTITDRIDLFNIVCVPGLTDASTIGTLQA